MSNTLELSKRAEKLETQGNWLEAGQLFERTGQGDRAISAYKRAGEVDRAAYLLENTGRGAEAGALFMSVGQHLQAAALFEKLRLYPRAATALLRANQRERAAAIYEKAEAWDDAAKIYSSLGNHRKALQLFTQAGNHAKVAELRQSISEQDAPPAGAAAHAAAEVLELDPDMEIGAQQYLESGQVVDAVVARLRKGDADGACALYENCQEDIGYNVLAAVAGDPEVEKHAAEMFYLARDYPKAGQVFENHEDWDRAGLMYERGDDAYMAAEMYSRSGNKGKAAEMLEKHGNFKQAAQFYLEVKNFSKAAINFEKAVNNFVAGKLYFRMNNVAKSLQLLQKVQNTESEYFDACRLIGEILAANGYLDLAIKKYLEVVRTADLSERTAPVYYNLARTLEDRGAGDKAVQLYERLLTWRFDYEDVGARLSAIKARPAGEAPPVAAAAPDAPAGPPVAPVAALPSPPAVAAPPSVPPVAPVTAAPDALPVLEPLDVAIPATSGGQVVTMMGGFEFLKKTPLFSELSLDEMKAIYGACEQRRFPAGEVLIEQDQPGEALFVLRKGTARVLKVAEEEVQLVAKLSPGSVAGEMALVDDAPTSARVVAESDVEAFVMSRAQFEKLVATNDKTALKLYRFFVHTLARRLRSTSDTLASSRARTA